MSKSKHSAEERTRIAEECITGKPGQSEAARQVRADGSTIRRICRKKDIKSIIKYRNNGCTRQAENPQHLAENILNREFTDKPNEK